MKYTKNLFKEIKLKNNIFNASGTLGYGLEFENIFNLNLLGALVLKSTTIDKRIGNKLPHIYIGKNFVINSVGLKNPGIKKAVEVILPTLENKYPNLPIISSVWGEKIEDYVYLVKQFSKFKNVIAIEINISCPNIKKFIDYSSNIEILKKLVILLFKSTGKHLIFKLSPNKNIINVVKALEELGIQYVTVANTYPCKYLKNNEPVVGNIHGGLSGKKIKSKTLELVKLVNKNTKNIKIIGAGGIYSEHDANEYFDSGASAIQVGSANLIDINIIKNICKNFTPN